MENFRGQISNQTQRKLLERQALPRRLRENVALVILGGRQETYDGALLSIARLLWCSGEESLMIEPQNTAAAIQVGGKFLRNGGVMDFAREASTTQSSEKLLLLVRGSGLGRRTKEF